MLLRSVTFAYTLHNQTMIQQSIIKPKCLKTFSFLATSNVISIEIGIFQEALWACEPLYLWWRLAHFFLLTKLHRTRPSFFLFTVWKLRSADVVALPLTILFICWDSYGNLNLRKSRLFEWNFILENFLKIFPKIAAGVCNQLLIGLSREFCSNKCCWEVSQLNPSRVRWDRADVQHEQCAAWFDNFKM